MDRISLGNTGIHSYNQPSNILIRSNVNCVVSFEGLVDLQQQSLMSSSLLTSQQDGHFVKAIRTLVMDYGGGADMKMSQKIKE